MGESHSHSPFSIFAVAILASVLGAQIASAQYIRGRLLDVATNRPIPAGVLTLHGADSTVVVAVMSDADGNWRLNAPRPGLYYIAARRMGYRPWVSGAVQIDAGAELNSEFHLQALPVTLEPITAYAQMRRNLEDNGFFERQRGNFGHFLTPEAIERRQAARTTDLLTAIPGVQLTVTGGGNVGPAQIMLRGGSMTGGALCRPRVYVDGIMYARGDSRPVRVRDSEATEQADLDQRMDRALSLDDIGHPSTIAAIEVYRSATQVPVQFGGTSVETLCGVIVVWTRTGRTPTARQ